MISWEILWYRSCTLTLRNPDLLVREHHKSKDSLKYLKIAFWDIQIYPELFQVSWDIMLFLRYHKLFNEISWDFSWDIMKCPLRYPKLLWDSMRCLSKELFQVSWDILRYYDLLIEISWAAPRYISDFLRYHELLKWHEMSYVISWANLMHCKLFWNILRCPGRYAEIFRVIPSVMRYHELLSEILWAVPR